MKRGTYCKFIILFFTPFRADQIEMKNALKREKQASSCKKESYFSQTICSNKSNQLLTTVISSCNLHHLVA